MKWATNGAPKGNAADMPPAPKYADGWQLGTPDKIYEMTQPYEVPAAGTVNYEYFYIPTDIKEPTWVKGIEIRPSARAVVHHVLMYYWAKPDMQRGPPFCCRTRNRARSRTAPWDARREGRRRECSRAWSRRTRPERIRR
jgi:hypothetical protein